jgi:hypothetical protein
VEAFVGRHLATYKEFAPRQRAASSSFIDRAPEKGKQDRNET